VERIFWVTCPDCDGAFYAHYQMRHAGVPLMCPFCRARFLPEQAASLDERWHEESQTGEPPGS
jgi:hypothetical protein